MATSIHTDEKKTGSNSSQVPTKTVRYHVERQSEKRRDQGDWVAGIELVIKERRLRWLGHVLRMEDSRIPRQAIQWELRGYATQEGVGTAKDKLDGHCETRSEGYGYHLG